MQEQYTQISVIKWNSVPISMFHYILHISTQLINNIKRAWVLPCTLSRRKNHEELVLCCDLIILFTPLAATSCDGSQKQQIFRSELRLTSAVVTASVIRRYPLRLNRDVTENTAPATVRISRPLLPHSLLLNHLRPRWLSSVKLASSVSRSRQLKGNYQIKTK